MENPILSLDCPLQILQNFKSILEITDIMSTVRRVRDFFQVSLLLYMGKK